MYRDSANVLDERDRAVGAILIGEALVDEIKRAQRVIRAGEALSHHERWRTITDVHDTYPEVWRHLDRARDVLKTRGANTMRYDELRPRARRAPTNADGTDIDPAALDDARRAIEDLKLALPGADWKGIATRTRGLTDKPLSRPRGQRNMLYVAVTMFVFGLVAWSIGIIPEHKVPRREAMRRELTQMQRQRKVAIEMTRAEIGRRCDVERARELTKLLVMDGRTDDARAFGSDYIVRCGDDAVVDNWANAPRPPQPD